MKLALPILLATSILSNANPMKPEYHYTTFIAKPAETVWSAITEKKTIDQYYMVPALLLELKKGGKITYGTTEPLISGTITEIKIPTLFTHTFNFTGSEDPETTVTYEITPIGDAMCALKVSHTGFTEDSQTYADVTGGWPVILSSLKTLLETGKPLPWPKAK